jgi:hypothetical protein
VGGARWKSLFIYNNATVSHRGDIRTVSYTMFVDVCLTHFLPIGRYARRPLGKKLPYSTAAPTPRKFCVQFEEGISSPSVNQIICKPLRRSNVEGSGSDDQTVRRMWSVA